MHAVYRQEVTQIHRRAAFHQMHSTLFTLAPMTIWTPSTMTAIALLLLRRCWTTLLLLWTCCMMLVQDGKFLCCPSQPSQVVFRHLVMSLLLKLTLSNCCEDCWSCGCVVLVILICTSTSALSRKRMCCAEVHQDLHLDLSPGAENALCWISSWGAPRSRFVHYWPHGAEYNVMQVPDSDTASVGRGSLPAEKGCSKNGEHLCHHSHPFWLNIWSPASLVHSMYWDLLCSLCTSLSQICTCLWDVLNSRFDVWEVSANVGIAGVSGRGDSSMGKY